MKLTRYTKGEDAKLVDNEAVAKELEKLGWKAEKAEKVQ